MKGENAMNPRFALTAVALALLPLAAGAQSFRCVGTDGKKYYGSTVPPQCLGQPVEQLSSQGTVLRRIDPQGDEKQRVAKEADADKKRKEADIAREAQRRNRALLATYSSEKDIEEARARALADNEKQIKDIQARIDGIKKRQAGFDKEMEFYRDTPAAKGAKAKPGPKPPPKLVEDMQNAEVDLQSQENLIDIKKKEVMAINAKYDEDKRRYAELTRK
jgi:glucan-binding YG repeat protein